MLKITASPCLLHSMILTGFPFYLFIYISICVYIYMYKNRALFHCNMTSGWKCNLLQQIFHMYTARSHSMSVDLISNLTPQEIFNKSKKPNIVTEHLLSQFFSKLKSCRKLVPLSVHKGFSEDASVCLTVLAFSVHKFLNDFKPFLVSSLSLPLSQRQ